jgi:hypothetical protein
MKRTAIRRSAPLVRTKPETARLTIKAKKCKHCRTQFIPHSAWQAYCRAEDCAVAAGAEQTAKRQKEEAKAKAAEARLDRAKKESLKTLRQLQTEAQTEFNRWSRHRDRLAGYGCISCGKPFNWHSDKPGGEVDAGHYMSRGGSPELAFVVANVNAQHKSCNRPGGAKRAAFREGMIERHGLAAVEELEGPTEPARLRHDDYREIRDTYRAKANELERQIKQTTTQETQAW